MRRGLGMSAEHVPDQTNDPDFHDGLGVAVGPAGSEPFDLWDWLPRLPLRQVRIEEWLVRWQRQNTHLTWLNWLESRIGGAIELGPPEVVWRASGLRRPGLIAQ